jgi:hypothetical protein
VPWAGRTLTPQPFAGDDGSPDPVLGQALSDHAAGRGSLRAVAAALAEARVMVPIVAVLGDEHPLPSGLRGDLGADMALVTLTGADGRRALPVFTGTAALAGWDATARPVPVEAARAAQAAVAEGCDVLVLDPAGPVPLVLPRPVVWALGQGRPWLPAAEDPEVLAAVGSALGGLDAVLAVRCETGPGGDLRVAVGVQAGLDPAGLDAVLLDVRAVLAAERLLAERVDALDLVVLPA